MGLQGSGLSVHIALLSLFVISVVVVGTAVPSLVILRGVLLLPLLVYGDRPVREDASPTSRRWREQQPPCPMDSLWSGGRDGLRGEGRC